MTKNTPEPWAFFENADANSFYITSESQWVLGLIHNGEPLPAQQKVNMRRIVTCVNACAGISSEILQSDMFIGAIKLKADLIDVLSQRNDLVEALKASRKELQACQAVIHLAGGFDPAYVDGARKSIKETDALIKKVTGETLW